MQYNSKEQPGIINPECDIIPTNTFAYDENGRISASNDEKRFSETIEILKLNRMALLYHRKNLFVELNKKYISIKTDTRITNIEAEKKKILFDLVKKSLNVEEDYSALRNYLVKYYKEDLINR